MRDILNEMSDGILVIGMDGRIRQHNRAAGQLLGLPGASLKGQPITAFMEKAEGDDILFQAIMDAVQQKQQITRTVPYFREGEMLYFRIKTDPLRSEEIQNGMVVQITDITVATMLFIANKRLANQVLNLMNSFVEVMVTAVEEKSAYNANHTKSMVRYADRYLNWLADKGELTEHTSENTAPFLMSVWLHDIGKLLVPPEIMDKPTRLGNTLKDVQHRAETAKLMLRIEMLSHPQSEAEALARIRKIEQAEALILSANTAGFLEETVIERLRDAACVPCMAADGSIRSLLGEDELACITVQRGTLTAEERSIIESHVSYTAKLLSKVEFRGDYKPVPKWASCHHELLDGSGYPEHLKGESIPWETRLLTILDVYDALTAEDRPYKPPMPPEKAFSILRDMAQNGKLDGEILQSFYESGAWKIRKDDTEQM